MSAIFVLGKGILRDERDERDLRDKREVAISIVARAIPLKTTSFRGSDSDEERDERAEQARAMRDEGMSYRQIAEELGYKSPQSVSNLLNRA